MNREKCKKILPLLKAFANGEAIEFYDYDCWVTLESVTFAYAPDRYRIKQFLTDRIKNFIDEQSDLKVKFAICARNEKLRSEIMEYLFSKGARWLSSERLHSAKDEVVFISNHGTITEGTTEYFDEKYKGKLSFIDADTGDISLAIKDMTVEEIEKALGYKIKVIGAE